MTVKFDALNAQRIQESIQQYSHENLDTPYTGKIDCFDTIDSTNAWLLENGKDGDFCLSETQTAGRGRRDNSWISPDSGNIYLSYCCYFDKSIEHRSLLGLVAGIAIAEALEEVGLSGHGLKWPNDIFWNGKKLGGILIQTADNYEKFVIGIGLNVSLPEESHNEITQAAVSLEEALNGKTFDREQLVIYLIQRLLSHSEIFAQLPFQAFLQSWNRWDILKGQAVSFQHQNQEIYGTVEGIDKRGFIGVLLESGIQYFSAADIKLKKPNQT
ncbi:MAG: biotin--[acetyl-CoA-carboxylase] ligase [Cocleimonas sp.]